jgi:hypothetical protein
MTSSFTPPGLQQREFQSVGCLFGFFFLKKKTISQILRVVVHGTENQMNREHLACMSKEVVRHDATVFVVVARRFLSLCALQSDAARLVWIQGSRQVTETVLLNEKRIECSFYFRRGACHKRLNGTRVLLTQKILKTLSSHTLKVFLCLAALNASSLLGHRSRLASAPSINWFPNLRE